MKKIVVLLVCFITVFSLCLNISAESENLVDGKWKKFNAGGLTQATEDGATVYTATGITAGYTSPGIDIYPAVKKAMGDNDEVSLLFSCEMRADFLDADSFSGMFVMRAGNIDASVKEAGRDGFMDIYEGTLFKNIDGINLIANMPKSNVEITSDWQTFSVIIDVYSEDLSDGLFGQWNVCLSSIKEFESVEALHIRNTKLIVSDGEEEPAETPTVTEAPVATAEPKATEAPTNTTVTEAPQATNNTPVKTPMPTNAPDPNAPTPTPEVVMVKTTGVSDVDVVLIVVDVVQIIAIIALVVVIIKKKKS